MAVGRAPQEHAILTSWKEIAAYLGKGVRTVQRWESRLGLPVRRPIGRTTNVYALGAELDEWLRTNWSYRSMQTEFGNASGGETDFTVQRELRNDQLPLVKEVQQNLQTLAERCQALLVCMTDEARVPLPADVLRRHLHQLKRTIVETTKLIERVGSNLGDHQSSSWKRQLAS